MADMPANTDEAKGRVKEAAGELVGNDDLEREGLVDKLVGKGKDLLDTLVEKGKDLLDKLGDALKRLAADRR